MNTKISDAAVEAAPQAYIDHDDTAETSIRAALTAALPHLRPQPAELAEQQGVREQFEAWARWYAASVERNDQGDYSSISTNMLWNAWQAALAATGKQQFGAKCLTCNDRGWVGGPTFSDPAEGGMQCPDCNALDAHMERYEQQVGEVQGDALNVEQLQELISRIHRTVSLGHQTGPHAYAGEDFGRYLAEAAGDCREIMRALAARQPVGEAEQLDHALGKTIDQRDRYHEVADDLAAHIERITGVEIGEHSSDNCPWQNAIDAAEAYQPTQGIDLGQLPRYSKSYSEGVYRDDSGDWVKWEDLHALINERDAAPGVGNG